MKVLLLIVCVLGGLILLVVGSAFLQGVWRGLKRACQTDAPTGPGPDDGLGTSRKEAMSALAELMAMRKDSPGGQAAMTGMAKLAEDLSAMRKQATEALGPLTDDEQRAYEARLRQLDREFKEAKDAVARRERHVDN